MKLLNNLFFVLALMFFGCKSAEDHRLARRCFPAPRRSGVTVREMENVHEHVIDQQHYNTLRDRGVVDENNLIRDNAEFRKLIARLKSIEMQDRIANRAEARRVAGERKQRLYQRSADENPEEKWDKIENDLISSGMSLLDARERVQEQQKRWARQEAPNVDRFKKLLRPVTIVKEDRWFTDQRNAQARREAQGRFDRGPFTIASESEQELVDSPTSEEDAEETEQLIQDFNRADMAGKLPDAYYEELQKVGLMDDQRTVLDYDKLGEFLLQKSRNE